MEKRLGLILAIQARIEGMKADNQFSKADNGYPKWLYSDFERESDKLKELVSFSEELFERTLIDNPNYF